MLYPSTLLPVFKMQGPFPSLSSLLPLQSRSPLCLFLSFLPALISSISGKHTFKSFYCLLRPENVSVYVSVLV